MEETGGTEHAGLAGGDGVEGGDGVDRVEGADDSQDRPGARGEEAVGVGPWPGPWPQDGRLDPDLLERGDARNVEDRYRYWTVDAIRRDVAARALGLEIAVENLGHDFNIGAIVRTANALGISAVHIVGRRRWNRRGAMVTDRYLPVDHLEDAQALAEHCRQRGLELIGVDNVPGSTPLEGAPLPARACLVFGEESSGLSPQMRARCSRILHITQRGSTRSMNVGHAAAIAMWAWATRAAD